MGSSFLYSIYFLFSCFSPSHSFSFSFNFRFSIFFLSFFLLKLLLPLFRTMYISPFLPLFLSYFFSVLLSYPIQTFSSLLLALISISCFFPELAFPFIFLIFPLFPWVSFILSCLYLSILSYFLSLFLSSLKLTHWFFFFLSSSDTSIFPSFLFLPAFLPSFFPLLPAPVTFLHCILF